VEQGRVIAFDKAAETVTFIVDIKHDTANPDYSGEWDIWCPAPDL
jgi:hypothetical protein